MRFEDALSGYHLPIQSAEGTVRNVRASLRLLSVTPDRVSFPLLAAVYGAPLGNADFSIFLTGRTGTFKSTLAGLCQQHYGATMDAQHLPGNFASTANSLEVLAFSAKDSLLVVDDFVPMGTAADRGLQLVAERLFRGIGNHQGRGRRRGGAGLAESLPPRALVLATGEQVPEGRSLRARMLIVETQPGDVNLALLSELQESGREGQLAGAMSAYPNGLRIDTSSCRNIFVNESKSYKRLTIGATYMPGFPGRWDSFRLPGTSGRSLL